MSRYELTIQAKDDLGTIWIYIARDSVEAADRVETALFEAFGFLAANPSAGHSRKYLTRLPVLFWTLPKFPNYQVVYDPASQPLTVLRILHGARDLARLIGSQGTVFNSGLRMNGLAGVCVYPLRGTGTLK